MFPRPSYADAAEGMVIEVDAPLRRSHYDWFWPEDGWEAPAFCSSRSRETEDDNTRIHADADTEARSEKLNNTIIVGPFSCLSVLSVLWCCNSALCNFVAS